MKKQYGIVPMSTKEYVESASESTAGGSKRIDVPLIKVENEENQNEEIITGGVFNLPSPEECKEATIEVAYRILGFPVTKQLLAHLPANVTTEHIGSLIPFYPFAYHKRFGSTWSDRVCPNSTRTAKCPVCEGRIALFQSAQYKSGSITKDDILKNGGFGTRQIGMFVAQVYFDGEDKGVCAVTVPLTNEMAVNARHDNFFDLVGNLTTPKKLLAGDNLPLDYYSNGDGSRWLVAEYTRALYGEDNKAAPVADGDKKKRYAPRPYWKLSKITPLKEIEGVGKAEDIWWPEIKKKDGAELVDIYALINHTPVEELQAIAEESVNRLLSPKTYQTKTRRNEEDAGDKAPAVDAEKLDWASLLDMDIGDLIALGEAKGGDAEELTLLGESNVAVLRRSVAKLCGVIPKAVNSTRTAKAEPQAQSSDGDGDGDGDDNLPF